MACRKNAYRGMVEMSEHLEKQREEQARRREDLERQQRERWTPSSLLERCCTQWLAHGPHQMVLSGPSSIMSSTTYRGCSGCAKEHPKIALAFDNGTATAELSHGFDAFVQYFDGLREATRLKTLRYKLGGDLSSHHEALKSKFGRHLVTIDPKALSASKRHYERMLEQDDQKQAVKRQRTLGEAAPTELLDSILEICYNNSLRELLDIADIAWMRTSSRVIAKYAAKMAMDRMSSIKLTLLPLVPKRDEHPKCSIFGNFEARGRRHLTADLNPNDCGSRWRCNDGVFTMAVENQDEIWAKISIYLERKGSTIVEKDILFGRLNRLEVLKYGINTSPFHPETGGDEIEWDAPSQTQQGGEFGTLQGECEFRCDSEEYRIDVTSVQFTFTDLLGVYLRIKLRQAKEDYMLSPVRRPADKAYIKNLAESARMAPGNAGSFRGMFGWDRVYGTQ
mmetsp:Transcript_11033/g.25107  ORF Transcript_11033/g.25107 Transcript_11033/m.25107 type:complete len:451 (+) Transcript_11033:264-1616(+)